MVLFPDNVILEDERALLRPLQESDLENLLSFALEEPEIWIYSFNSPAGKEGMEQYIRDTLAQRSARREYAFIVYDKVLAAYAGCTRFYDINLAFGTAQLGYTWYGKRFQRTGLNRHCKLLMLDFAFGKWGLQRVEFRADVKNARSIRAMKDIGCVEEGVLRSLGPSQLGGRRDSIVLSILLEEWLGGAKKNLQSKIYPETEGSYAKKEM